MAREPTTENDILSSIPDFDPGTDTSDNSGSSNDSTQTSQSADESRQGNSTQGTNNTSNTNTNTSEPNRQGNNQVSPSNTNGQQVVQRRHDGLVEVPNAENTRVRDLVDPITGRVVAHGGIERRIYENAQRHERENNDLRRQLQQATQAQTSNNQVLSAITTHGVSERDALSAIQLVSQFRRDPVGVLTALVSEVKAAGHNIPFLAEGVSPGIDVNAIVTALRNELSPITSRFAQEQATRQQEAERVQQGEQMISSFLNEFPEAQANLGTIAAMMERDPTLTLHSAFVRMTTWASQNGLDYTRPINDQIEQRRNNNNNQRGTPPQQPNQPPISGRQTQSVGQTPSQPIDNAGMFDPSESWRDIIANVVRSSG